ncbi:MAG: pyridoxamine 5'-phosphate oxidase family protein [Candidatus Hydrogenedentes bacterium]|nr:pyridoxamine 5'-phosphate oxidase family protein [Candidatus Hydrogenedentota bacterium]
MSVLPSIVSKALDDREGPAVFTTVNEAGIPNSVYVGFLHKFGEDKLVVADNYFDKTRKNVLAGCKGSLLFITKERKAFQVKGSLDYETTGDVYDDMKNGWLDAKYPGHAAVVVNVEEVFCGAEQLL